MHLLCHVNYGCDTLLAASDEIFFRRCCVTVAVAVAAAARDVTAADADADAVVFVPWQVSRSG